MALITRQVLVGGPRLAQRTIFGNLSGLVVHGAALAVGPVWLTLYAHLVHRAHRTLTRSDVKRWLERATGTVLVALGIRVALERR